MSWFKLFHSFQSTGLANENFSQHIQMYKSSTVWSLAIFHRQAVMKEPNFSAPHKGSEWNWWAKTVYKHPSSPQNDAGTHLLQNINIFIPTLWAGTSLLLSVDIDLGVLRRAQEFYSLFRYIFQYFLEEEKKTPKTNLS